jgi:amino acid transporter
MAIAAFCVNLVVIAVVLWKMSSADGEVVHATLALAQDLDRQTFLKGFATAWLAFSGLESISQLSPAMRTPLNGFFMADTAYYYPEDRSISESLQAADRLADAVLQA